MGKRIRSYPCNLKQIILCLLLSIPGLNIYAPTPPAPTTKSGGGGGGSPKKPTPGKQGTVDQPTAPTTTAPTKPGANNVTAGPSANSP